MDVNPGDHDDLGPDDRDLDDGGLDLTPRDTHVLIELHVGDAYATIITNDLTHDYVHENSAYAS